MKGSNTLPVMLLITRNGNKQLESEVTKVIHIE